MSTHRNILQSFQLIFLCVLFYLLLFYYLSSDVIIDTTYENSVDKKILEERAEFKEYKVFHGCSTLTHVCFSVIDKKSLLPLDHNIDTDSTKQLEIVERHMIVDGFGDDSDTVVRIVSPDDSHMSFDSSDTELWVVDHTDLRSQYVEALVAAPFLTSTLSLFEQDNENKSVLEIGLGGGSLDMFLHHYIPKLNITAVEIDPMVIELAHRWFGVTNGTYRRTIQADGIEYVKNAVERGEKYDVVVIDACDDNKDLPCPAKAFTDTQFLKNAKKIISVFIVNVLSMNDRHEDVISIFYQHFKSCFRITLSVEVNEILVCTLHTIDQSYMEFLKSRIPAVILHFSLPEFLVKILPVL